MRGTWAASVGWRDVALKHGFCPHVFVRFKKFVAEKQGSETTALQGVWVGLEVGKLNDSTLILLSD